jgi:hypothetical protein
MLIKHNFDRKKFLELKKNILRTITCSISVTNIRKPPDVTQTNSITEA